jgi:UMF1 family MFS transporter
MAGFFPIFFKQYWSYGTDVNISTAQLGFGNALASLIVALLAPILGAIADKGSARKKFLIFFAYLGVLMTAGLFLVEKGQWVLAIIFYVIGIIGFSGSIVFYDALLPLAMTLAPERFGLPDAAAAVRFAFITVAVWWGGFTVLTILWVPEEDTRSTAVGIRATAVEGLHQLFETFKEFRRLKTTFLFLSAYWFYIDGVDTIIRMAVDYGLSLGFQSTDLILALLMVQFIGFPAALGFGMLGQAFGVRRTIFLAIGCYIVITGWGTMVTDKREFFILAAMIGLVQGGIQALSRSYFARLIPLNRTAEYFGFYNMLGKFAAIIGPALMGAVGLIAKRLLMPSTPSVADIEHITQLASRWSIGSVAILFIVGGFLLYFVDEQKGKAEAAYFAKP